MQIGFSTIFFNIPSQGTSNTFYLESEKWQKHCMDLTLLVSGYNWGFSRVTADLSCYGEKL